MSHALSLHLPVPVPFTMMPPEETDGTSGSQTAPPGGDGLILIRDRIKAAGLAWTPQRAFISKVILEMPGYSTFESIASVVLAGNRKISAATVYRTLKSFASLGILSRLTNDRSPARYKLAFDPIQRFQFIDIESGETREIQDPLIESLFEKAAADLGYRLVKRVIGIQVERILSNIE